MRRWNEKEATEFGYEWPATGERMDRLEDALRICRAMFTEERATVEGKYHHVRDALNFPRPIQPGGPKILVGGGGERRTLGLVARYADACNLFGDVDTIRHKLSVIKGHCRDVGRDPSEITKTRLGTLILGRSKDEADEWIGERARRTGMPEGQVRAAMTIGDADVVGDQVQAFFDVGLDGMIFNMPPGTPPEDVETAGRILTERFGGPL